MKSIYNPVSMFLGYCELKLENIQNKNIDVSMVFASNQIKTCFFPAQVFKSNLKG